MGGRGIARGIDRGEREESYGRGLRYRSNRKTKNDRSRRWLGRRGADRKKTKSEEKMKKREKMLEKKKKKEERRKEGRERK